MIHEVDEFRKVEKPIGTIYLYKSEPVLLVRNSDKQRFVSEDLTNTSIRAKLIKTGHLTYARRVTKDWLETELSNHLNEENKDD